MLSSFSISWHSILPSWSVEVARLNALHWGSRMQKSPHCVRDTTLWRPIMWPSMALLVELPFCLKAKSLAEQTRGGFHKLCAWITDILKHPLFILGFVQHSFSFVHDEPDCVYPLQKTLSLSKPSPNEHSVTWPLVEWAIRWIRKRNASIFLFIFLLLDLLSNEPSDEQGREMPPSSCSYSWTTEALGVCAKL